jgi:lysophospholipase L1-like esterase
MSVRQRAWTDGAGERSMPPLCGISTELLTVIWDGAKIRGMKSLRTFLLAVAFSVSVWADHSAVTPVPRDANWRVRHDLLNKRAKENPDAELLFIGDSITQGWEGSGKDVWQKYYGNRKAINLGIGGDKTQHVLWRLRNGNIDGLKGPKAAVVMIGTNNSSGEENTPEQIVEGVQAIVKELRDRLPGMKILLLGIFPRAENMTTQRGKLAAINQVIQKLDDGKNVFYLDIGHKFLEKDGTLSASIMPDYLHPNAKGYEIWSEAMEPKLAELLGEKSK